MQCRCVAEVTVENGCYHSSALWQQEAAGQGYGRDLAGSHNARYINRASVLKKKIDLLSLA